MATRYFHWDVVDDCVMHETDEHGDTIVEYTREPGQFGPLLSENRGGTESYHHYDALGSTTFLTDEVGTVRLSCGSSPPGLRTDQKTTSAEG